MNYKFKFALLFMFSSGKITHYNIINEGFYFTVGIPGIPLIMVMQAFVILYSVNV